MYTFLNFVLIFLMHDRKNSIKNWLFFILTHVFVIFSHITNIPLIIVLRSKNISHYSEANFLRITPVQPVLLVFSNIQCGEFVSIQRYVILLQWKPIPWRIFHLEIGKWRTMRDATRTQLRSCTDITRVVVWYWWR